MAQMVLPQIPAPGAQQEPGPSRQAGSRDPADRTQDFESVSQAERKRLDSQKTERNDAAEARDTRAEDNRNAPAESSSDTRAPASERAGDSHGRDEHADHDTASASSSPEADTASASAGGEGDIDPALLPLTFAELQAFLNPRSDASGVALAASGLPGVAGRQGGGYGMALGQSVAGSGLFGGLLAQAAGQSAPGAVASTGEASPLGDAAKAAVLADLGRSPDASGLTTAGRFQGASDLLAQQVANGHPAGTRLTAETAAPLRGYATSIDVPVGHAEWGDKLVGKLSWLTARNMSVAEIHLTPPDMGPMEVRVRVQNEQASITVHSANPVVRDQLELHSHRLRDMLGEQGLALAGFDVSDSSQRQPGQQDSDGGQGAGSATASRLDDDSDGEPVSSGMLDLSWKGEVDIFA